jgi:nitrite reductase/ring-hydroxylating ferredoxin subunit
VLATHVPLNDRGVLWAKMHATRSYVVGAPLLEASVPDALFWDTADPYHYTRIARHGNDRFLVVGGEDRDVGDDDNDEQRYAALESFCRDRFGVADFPYRWSGQINEPADGLPFIGRSSQGERVWMATGYSGTGMTYGTLAAMLLSDLAIGRENRFAKLYDPGRTSPKAVVGHVLTKAVELPKRMAERVAGRDIEADSLDQVREGEGKIVKADGHRWAAARLADGLHVVDATCTHMGCTVEWNAAERSWDCPCHGSRFTIDGKVLNGPATEALAPPQG